MSNDATFVQSPVPWDLVRPRDIADSDWERFEDNIAEIFSAFGMELNTPGTDATPRRFLRAMYDATSGYDGDPKLLTAFPSEARNAPVTGQVVERDIAFASLCEHHALPFVGVVHLGYVPNEEIIGISKLTRLVRLFARRFSVQERLVEQIADTLGELVNPRGVAVFASASHLCTQMRGVEERSRTITTAWRGEYLSNDALRQEFLTVTGSNRAADL
jgi:GTP cyclohydrolase I